MSGSTNGTEKPKIYNRSTAMFFLILTGVISLLGDMNYEGGRSVVGQYLNLLGTSALALGLAAGLGEFIGYAFRLVSGTLVDRTKKYWLFIFIGFTIQLCSLPVMAFVSGWKLAVAFLFFERLGKAIKSLRMTRLSLLPQNRRGAVSGSVYTKQWIKSVLSSDRRFFPCF